jgi:hypothetical protein
VMLWTRPLRLGLAITRPTKTTAFEMVSGFTITVRTSRMRWVGFGTKTLPSGSRRGESPGEIVGLASSSVCPSWARAASPIATIGSAGSASRRIGTR